MVAVQKVRRVSAGVVVITGAAEGSVSSVEMMDTDGSDFV